MAKDSLSWKKGKKRRRGRGEGEGGRGRAGLLPVPAKSCCHLPPRARSAGMRRDAQGCAGMRGAGMRAAAAPSPSPFLPFPSTPAHGPRSPRPMKEGSPPKARRCGNLGRREKEKQLGARRCGVLTREKGVYGRGIKALPSVHKPQVDLIK